MAKDRGYTVGALYAAFKDKAELLVVVDQRRLDAFRATWNETLATATDASAARMPGVLPKRAQAARTRATAAR